MTDDRERYYVFDTHLDDSIQWETGRATCGACGFDYAYVRRLDRTFACPRCGPTGRWEAREERNVN